jgi:aspartate/methionine/tyrosine aminotransferase
MSFIPFELEKWQSDYEDDIQFNLADSGVHPVALGELVEGPVAVARLLETPLHYPPVNGSRCLRQTISALYEGADVDNVLVTVGAAEANAITLQALLEPGDEVVVMEPCYRQVWGTMQNLGCRVRVFTLDPANDWRPRIDELEAMVTPRTKLIGVTNPNNPTGAILTRKEMNRILAIAARNNAWLLADEVYRGSERLTDTETPSFYGAYERVVATNSLSKAYGLSGLRIGWVVAPRGTVQQIQRRHEYATISTGMLSMRMAERALSEPLRSRLLARNRKLIRDGYARIESWVQRHNRLLSVVPPQATALVFVRYNLKMSSVELAQLLRRKANVLVAPGEYFGVDQHLRVTHGLKEEYLTEALNRMTVTLEGLVSDKRVRSPSAGR